MFIHFHKYKEVIEEINNYIGLFFDYFMNENGGEVSRIVFWLLVTKNEATYAFPENWKTNVIPVKQ